MTTYHVKRNGKLYGPFELNGVAKCINTDIFTAKDEISDDQITWMTVEKFQAEQKIVKVQPVQPIPVVNGNPCMGGSYNVPMTTPYVPSMEGNAKYIRHYRLIAAFLGGLGIHDFWSGYIMHGVIKLILTLFGLGIISQIWSVVNIFNVTTDAKGIPLRKGGCGRSVYILLCIFMGLAGIHHLYAGFLVKWLVQSIVTAFVFVVVIFFSALVGEEGLILAFISCLIFDIIILILGCCQKVDADGNAFV